MSEEEQFVCFKELNDNLLRLLHRLGNVSKAQCEISTQTSRAKLTYQPKCVLKRD
jgi:hypothetical protein